jgi:hypothetical protein
VQRPTIVVIDIDMVMRRAINDMDMVGKRESDKQQSTEQQRRGSLERAELAEAAAEALVASGDGGGNMHVVDIMIMTGGAAAAQARHR